MIFKKISLRQPLLNYSDFVFAKDFCNSFAYCRTMKINDNHVFDVRKISKTMGKIMGTKDPQQKVTYKPGLQLSKGPALRNSDFQAVPLRKGEKAIGDNRSGPTPGNRRRAKQLSDVMFLRITEMIHSGDVHPVFQENKLEIVSVKMFPDMRNLHIYWALTGDVLKDQRINEQLNDAAWEIRRQIAGLQIIGRTPTVRFIGDDKALKMAYVFNLIETSEKPPEEDDNVKKEENQNEFSEKSILECKDFSNLTSFDGASWNELEDSVQTTRDALGLNFDKIMSKVKVERHPMQMDTPPAPHSVETSITPSWRVMSQSKDELSVFLKKRQQNIKKKDRAWGKSDEDEDFSYDHENYDIFEIYDDRSH